MDPNQRAIAAEFDSYKDRYADAVNASLSFSGLEVDFFTRAKAKYLLDLLAAQFGSSDTVRLLDLGCGVGTYHPLLRPHLQALTGVDIAQECVIRAARDNPTVAYDTYDGRALPYADAIFDSAVAICVIHHVPPAERPGFFAEALRVIRPGGTFTVFEHNPLNPLTRRVVNRCPFDRDAVLLRAGETQERLRGAGFVEIKTRFILTIPPMIPGLFAVDRVFGAIPLGAQYYVSGRKADAAV